MQLSLLKNSEPIKRIVNVSTVPHRSPFRYPGGKTWFVPAFRKWISFAGNKPKVLLEPFAGGAIVGLTAAFEGYAEKVVLVELDVDVAAVWETILKGNFQKLAEKIVNFELTLENVQLELDAKPASIFHRAFQTILRNRVSHGGIMAPGSGLIKNGENGKGISSRWYPETLAGRIRDIGRIRHKIEFVHGSAFDVIPRYIEDRRNYIFIDPPYTAAGKKAGRRLYKCNELDHAELFAMLANAKCDFLFTYDESDNLKNLAAQHDLKTKLISMKNTHHSVMTELIIGKNLKWLSDN